jgi:hypothetical protein
MRRREFIALSGASVAWPFAAMAQERGRQYRLGCLLPLTRDASINVAFFDELRRRGFNEGQNLTVEYRAYGQHVDLISNSRRTAGDENDSDSRDDRRSDRVGTGGLAGPARR